MTRSGSLIVLNGSVVTLDGRRPRAAAVGIRDGWIAAVGSEAEVRAALPGVPTLDLAGGCAVPGLVDAHIHLLSYSHALSQVHLEGVTTIAAAVDETAKVAARLPANAWVIGGGWRQDDFADGRAPTATDLDRLLPERPAVLFSRDHHSIWCNRAALTRAGITSGTNEPAGGKIERDADGSPTGLLFETAEHLVTDHIPARGEADRDAALRAGLAALLAKGHTGIHGFPGGSSPVDRGLVLSALQRLRTAGDLPLRVYQMVSMEDLDHLIALGLRTGFGDDWLRLGHLKLFADGALGSRTAWMVEAYDSDPANHGIPIYDVAELRALIERGARAGLVPSVHAIGDRANHEVLNVYAAGRAEGWLAPSMRPRIEHVQVLLPSDLPRLASLGVVASMQPIHCTSDMAMADRHWGARGRYAYAWSGLLERGTVLAFGSDAPVEAPDPIAGLHAAVTRQSAAARPTGGWYPAGRIAIEEALTGYSVGAAFAASTEERFGRLSPGLAGDLTVLSADPTTLPGEDLLSLQVDFTIVAGRVAYARR